MQAQTSQFKIGVIEDDMPICTMYEFKLKSAGFSVQCAHDGTTGLAMCEQFKPDLILLDQRMPTMNGDEMLAKLRQTDWGAEIRVIILTNISKDEAPQSLRVLNIDRYIVKAHHTPAQVIDVVKNVLSIPS